jgi:hypothetical protein
VEKKYLEEICRYPFKGRPTTLALDWIDWIKSWNKQNKERNNVGGVSTSVQDSLWTSYSWCRVCCESHFVVLWWQTAAEWLLGELAWIPLPNPEMCKIGYGPLSFSKSQGSTRGERLNVQERERKNMAFWYANWTHHRRREFSPSFCIVTVSSMSDSLGNSWGMTVLLLLRIL